MKHKIKLLLLIAISFSITVNAQMDRFFHSLGFGGVFAKTNLEYNLLQNGVKERKSEMFDGLFFTTAYKLRLNILQNENSSLGIVTAPLIGLGRLEPYEENVNYEMVGKHIFYLPVTLQLSFGRGATYYNQSDKGFTIGMGLAWYKLPLKYDFTDTDNFYKTELVNKSTAFEKQFCLNIGYRHDSKSATEYNLSIGISEGTTIYSFTYVLDIGFELREKPLEKKGVGYSRSDWKMQLKINTALENGKIEKYKDYNVYSYIKTENENGVSMKAFNKWKNKYGRNYHFFKLKGKYGYLEPLFLSKDEYEFQTKEIARKRREEKLEKERREKEWAEAAKRRKEQERLRKEREYQEWLAIYPNEKSKAKYRANKLDKLYFIEDDKGFYIGETKNGKRHGKGKFVWKLTDRDVKDCDYYEGDWLNGKREGYGKFIHYFRDKGSFLILVWDNYKKSIYKGNYKNDERHGEGNLNGDRVLYENGKLIRNYDAERRQRESDSQDALNNGEIDVPSYTTENGSNGSVEVEFSDYITGILFYNKQCGKYYVDTGLLGNNFYYNSFSTAVRALYLYKTKHIIMNGHVSCN